MIRRLRGRNEFAVLRRHGRRGRSGPITVTTLPRETPAVADVGFAVGRRVGSAVVRNRRRRQLRALVDALDRTEPELFGPGTYLVSLSPTGADFEELRRALRAAVGDARGDGSRVAYHAGASSS